MKKILTILTFLCMIGLVIATGVPHPLYGKITNEGVPVSGLEINIKNLNTGNEKTTSTNKDGFYQVDMPNFDPSFQYGNTVRTTVVFCETLDKCKKSVVLENTGGTQISFDIAGVPDIPEQPEPVEVIKHVCEDGSEVDNPEDCISTSTTSGDKTVSIDAYYGQEINLVLGNNKLKKLLDTEIRFDGDYYDVSEEVTLIGQIQTSLDDEDFGTSPYFVIEEASYSYIFDDVIDISLINEDETLEVVILGKTKEISKAESDSITLMSGEEYDLEVGKIKEILGKSVEITRIGKDYIRVNVDGAIDTIYTDEIEGISGIEIKLIHAMPDDDVPDLAVIQVAEDIEVEIEDGDDYGPLFEWVIEMDGSPQVIGVINREEFKYLDEEESPLGIGDKINFPEGYIGIKLDRVTTPELTELDIRTREGYLLIEGDLSAGSEDYDEVNIDNSGIYDEDFIEITEPVQVGDSNIFLDGGTIGNLFIELDMSDILYNGVSFASKDEIYLDYFGIIFKDPEQAVDDQRNFEVIIPEERPEVTITVGEDIISEKEECTVVSESPLIDDLIACPEPTICLSCPAQVVCPEPVTCPEPKGSTLAEIISTILVGLGGLGIGGYYIKRKEALSKGIGIKIYTKRDGTEGVYHKHPGITGYHDPNTSHRDVRERHPKGELTPKYEKNLEGNWEYVSP